MPHIHKEAGQHDFTASAYIVRTDGAEPQLLLHQHKKLGILLQFGGHIETDETPWQAITHELLEESGYELNQLELLQPKNRIAVLSNVDLHPYPLVIITHPFSPDHFHTDIAWAFTATAQPKNGVSDGESDSLQLFRLDELKALEANKIPENVREIGIFILTECLAEWERAPVTSDVSG